MGTFPGLDTALAAMSLASVNFFSIKTSNLIAALVIPPTLKRIGEITGLQGHFFLL